MKTKVPVLLVTFNRLDTTKKVFEAIRQYKPDKFFVASDGAREFKEGELDIVNQVRNYVTKNVDWECEVKTLFREKNLGCGVGPFDAISWFFSNVEMGIILEDDCVPTKSFFTYCNELLEKYKYEEKILSLTGYNIIGSIGTKESYIFSRYLYGWGWATWSRAWKKMDFKLEKYIETRNKGELKKYYHSYVERKIIDKKVDDCIKGNVSAWDYQWIISHHMNNALTVVPRINLVENLGFSDVNSTHTKENYWDMRFLRHNSNEMAFPLIHPSEIQESKKYFRKYLIREILRIGLKKIFRF